MPGNVVDEHFKNAGKKSGLEIWRIKKFEVIPVDKAEYGNFHSGDSYIVLSTTKSRDSDQLYWDAHFWLGSRTSPDEMGTAAIKTVELDDSLGGLPVQYREVEDHESALFLSYFKNGIKYLQGGFESGFFKVGDLKIEPRLFQCKGKRNVRSHQVKLARESLNKGDVFILDCGEDIYVWAPPKSGRLERIKGIRQACNIRDAERAGRGQVHVLGLSDYYNKDWDSNPKFWGFFGGYSNDIKTAVEGGVDEGYWTKDAQKNKVQLWKVSDASGQMEVSSVGYGDIKGDMLDSKDAFILDPGVTTIFVWVGKECTMEERKKAMQFATVRSSVIQKKGYLERNNRPKWTQVTRVLETAEPGRFMQWFTAPPANSITFKKKPFEPHLFNVSDETGNLVIDEVADFTQQDLDGDDVMILDGSHTVYVWIGSGATEAEKHSAAAIAKKYITIDTMPRPSNAKVVTCEQNQEPDEFKKLFPDWNDDLFSENTVENVKKSLHAEN